MTKASELIRHLEEGGKIRYVAGDTIISTLAMADEYGVCQDPHEFEKIGKAPYSVELYIDPIESYTDSESLYQTLGVGDFLLIPTEGYKKVRITVEEI